MPRANDNRPVVGTVPCDGCHQTKALYQVQTGKKAGYLYGRCGCGADQRTGAHIQREWLRTMTPRETDQWLPHPLNLEPEPKPEPDPVGTGQAEPEPVGTTKQPRGGLLGLAVLAGAAALAIIGQ